ncbi:GNAT family N-acetyltransferase [Kribbella sp. NPDC056861]|uniref:GNAT family N-acetyltransferase n=1 Tax=Kribbella sp. NPDC056861 TaxID=3154857 RepID=UPI00344265C8
MSSSKTPPPVTLRPPAEDEFDSWRTRAVEAFAVDMGPTRDLDPAAALLASRQDFDRLLPDGVSTENQLIWLAHHDDVQVGSLWVSTAKPTPFIYMIDVLAEQRSKGYGRSIMLAGEEECRRRGYEHLDLNVFGSNTTAVRLYDSLGYVVTSQQMRKKL